MLVQAQNQNCTRSLYGIVVRCDQPSCSLSSSSSGGPMHDAWRSYMAQLAAVVNLDHVAGALKLVWQEESLLPQWKSGCKDAADA